MQKYVLDFLSSKKPLPHYWELCVGSCHAATALREDYRRQLEKCHRELGFKYVRFHGLFDDDMSVLLKGGNLGLGSDSSDYRLSFMNIDSIFDFLLSIGMKPFVELGFMPSALTSGPTTIFHYKGHTSPPDDYGKWQWLIEQFASHCVERYGLDEVRQWFFEVWNEPNLGGPEAPMGFWGGTMEEYFRLYEYAARGLKAVDPRLRIGGPATSANSWIPEFLEFCRSNDVPVDFVSTHHYPTDDIIGLALDEFLSVRKKAQAGEVDQAAVAEAMAKMAEVRNNAWKKVPRGTLTEMAKKAKSEAGDLPLYYTEWNSLAGLPSDGPFGASFIVKTILDNVGLVEGYSYWTFSDIFEEGGMPHKEFHGGYGLLTLHGVPKAPYRAFELLHKLGTELYDHVYTDGTVDIYAIHKAESGSVQLLAVNHQSLLQDINAEQVSVKVEGLPSFVKATIERVDEHNGNALRRFNELGAPDYINNAAVLHDLISASYTKAEPIDAKFENGVCELTLDLPEQGIALVTLYY